MHDFTFVQVNTFFNVLYNISKLYMSHEYFAKQGGGGAHNIANNT